MHPKRPQPSAPEDEASTKDKRDAGQEQRHVHDEQPDEDAPAAPAVPALEEVQDFAEDAHTLRQCSDMRRVRKFLLCRGAAACLLLPDAPQPALPLPTVKAEQCSGWLPTRG